MRTKYFTLILLSSILFTLPSCAKKKLTPTPFEARIGNTSVSVMQEFKDAYEDRDISEMRRLSTSDGFRQISVLMKDFDIAELDLNPKWLDIKDKEILLYMSWKGKWIKNNDTTNERGLALFILKRDSMRLDQVMRSSPFIYPLD